MKRKSPIELARETVQAALKGKPLLRVNYAALNKDSTIHTEAQFFLTAGWYRDYPFHCADCRKLEVWSAAQQKWWYEIAKGSVLTTATRCRACRKSHRVLQEQHRAKTLAGIARKTAERQRPVR